jgi:hypothetical protein
MIWLFWGLLVTLIGAMLILAIVARRGCSSLRPARLTTWQLLRAVGHSFAGVLWTISHSFGYGYGGSHRYDFDPSKDYVREHERKLEEERQRFSEE